MIEFMDYIVHAFGTSTNWNHDNSYSSLTATSDGLLSFQTPSTLALHVSSLSTGNFASSYTLSTLGQIDGSLSYLYSTVPLGHLPSQTTSIPLKKLVRGYRDVRLPVNLTTGQNQDHQDNNNVDYNARKPTLLHATLALPPPSTLTALYARRINPETLLSLSIYSKSVSGPLASSTPPPASCLAHIQHDTGRYSLEGLGSTDSALLGARGLWNFGLSPPETSEPRFVQKNPVTGGDTFVDFPSGLPLPPQLDALSNYHNRLASKPSLLSAGAEFYYSPFSHVIGLSTGLRFTTLTPHILPSTESTTTSHSNPSVISNKPLAGTSSSLLSTAGHTLLTPSNISHSSFPYTMTLTCTPLTGSISSSYSVRPTPTLALSSRFDFNFYSWESRYVVGGELWRRRRKTPSGDTESSEDPLAWARQKTQGWFSAEEQALKDERLDREEENVLKFRMDDSWNVRALWTGRVKSLLVSAGVSVAPVVRTGLRSMNSGGGMDGDGGGVKKWSGTVGVSIAYST